MWTLLLAVGLLVPDATAPHAGKTGTVDRIVVLLTEDDPATSKRVLGAMRPCTGRVDTAVVSTAGGIHVREDFSRDGASLSLAEQLSGKERDTANTVGAALGLLVEALGSRAPTTTIVLVSSAIGSDPGATFPASPGVVSPANRSTEDEPSSAGEIGFADTPAIPESVYAARKVVRRSEATLIAVNVGGRYDPALKALTEIPRGRYLRPSQKNFAEALVSAVCGGR
jgi:hypothetical protein